MCSNPRVARGVLIDVQKRARNGKHDRTLRVELDVIPPPNLDLRRVPTDVRTAIPNHNENRSLSTRTNLMPEHVETVSSGTAVRARVKAQRLRINLRDRELKSLSQRLRGSPNSTTVPTSQRRNVPAIARERRKTITIRSTNVTENFKRLWRSRKVRQLRNGSVDRGEVDKAACRNNVTVVVHSHSYSMKGLVEIAYVPENRCMP